MYIKIIGFLFLFTGLYSCFNSDNNITETYNSKTRAAWQKPDVVISKLGDITDKTIADIGAGTGYFSFRFVLKCKKLIAIDIDKDMLELMNLFALNLPEEIQDKFETRLAANNNPKLKGNEVDIIVVINTFSYINNRVDYLKTINKGLKDGGQIMILNFKSMNISPDSPPKKERISLETMKNELIESGYTIKEIDKESLEHQYIIIATK